VPRGAVISYQALGAAVGVPKGARTVGNALHNNPVAIYVPCHRVISADGRIGGYAGGASRKLLLLRSEGFAVDSARGSIPSNVVWGHKGTMIYCRPDCRTAARVDRTRIFFSLIRKKLNAPTCVPARPAGLVLIDQIIARSNGAGAEKTRERDLTFPRKRSAAG
jgi:O-6-methylguanine DNA methyltransferase